MSTWQPAAASHALESLPAAVAILDSDGALLHANRVFLESSGRAADELLGADWFELFVAGEDRVRARACFERAARHGNSETFHGALASRQERPTELLFTLAAVEMPTGAKHMAAIGCDIARFRAADQRLTESARLAAIYQIMNGMTHDIRNVLQRSNACLEMLAMELKDHPTILDLVVRVQSAQRDMQQLYEDVRAYAAPIHLNRQPRSLVELCRETAGDARRQFPDRSIELVEEIAAEAASSVVDGGAIGQILRHIVDNAASVSRPQGPIVIRCSKATLDDHEAIEIVVRDSGPRLTDEQRERALAPFAALRGHAVGVTLATAQRIAQAHGGAVKVRSCEPAGAEVVVTLPRG
ncbi:MAG: HAMP domain-containing histidine kinase [Planctomycetia bacterium]|nr:HAMP domain-containing histidine kinase [Planctomycetia bacterium]